MEERGNEKRASQTLASRCLLHLPGASKDERVEADLVREEKGGGKMNRVLVF